MKIQRKWAGQSRVSKLGRITICYLIEWKLPYLLRATLRYMCIQGRGEGTHLKSSDRCTIKAQSVSFLQNSINTPILEGPAPRVDCRLLIIRKNVDRQFWQRPERKISKAGPVAVQKMELTDLCSVLQRHYLRT